MPKKTHATAESKFSRNKWSPRRSVMSSAEWRKTVRGYRRPSWMSGGMATGMHPDDLYFAVIRGELQRGARIELEHTREMHVALSIAMDHLVEDSRYYLFLERMERKLSES